MLTFYNTICAGASQIVLDELNRKNASERRAAVSETIVKAPMEEIYKDELAALRQCDSYKKPENWKLSPQMVRTFILGANQPIKYEGRDIFITKKYYGNDALIERAVITLAGNRGLMLVGEPGTAKTMLSELLSAAISGISTNTIQGTAGTTEDMIKYSWNYALLISNGPDREALVPSPLYVGMEKGIITRFEEITRTPAEIQDCLISVMSDKVLHVPELGESGYVFAKQGFNVIGTANTRDKGVNEMSSALKRRFNFETVFPVKDVSLEKQIIIQEVTKMAQASSVEMKVDEDAAEILAITYHELREGIAAEGQKIDTPMSVMSTAEAVSVYYQTMLSAYYYGEEHVSMQQLTENLISAAVKENKDDVIKIRSYFQSVIKDRADREGGLWKDYYQAGRRL